MKILDNACTTIEFSTIKIGECFLYNNHLCVKIQPICDVDCTTGYYNAFCFVDNAVLVIPSGWFVIPVEADIVIRSKGVQYDT